MDFAKGALVFTTFAVHLHSFTISGHGYGLGGYYYYDDDDYDYDDYKGNRGKHGRHNDNHRRDYSDRDDAIKAFLIIAFLLYLASFILQVISHTGGDLKLSKKIIGIILFILLVLAGIVLSLPLYIRLNPLKGSAAVSTGCTLPPRSNLHF